MQSISSFDLIAFVDEQFTYLTFNQGIKNVYAKPFPVKFNQ